MRGFLVRFRTASLISAAILGIGGGLVAATPANAAASQCPQGKVCLFHDKNFGGEMYITDGTCVPSLQGESFPGNYPTVNDSVSSIVNNSGYTLRLFQNSGFGGRWTIAYAQVADFTQGLTIYNSDGTTSSSTSFNDQLSSIWSTTC
ncbi:peptidase inhibitor family I36 protein [Streptomyces sp. NPDC093509]|uniref:peptidase inhibitor family I36 protein n=1 Tax=Streptomyces sp. NPDC093509 TaxID=3154982 RepID=UPI003450DA5A